MADTERSPDAIGYRRLALILIVLGLLFAVDSYVGAAIVWRLWPLMITIMGVGFLGIFARRESREAPYLIVGVYLICFSALALYCNFTTWAVLAALWPLFVGFLGLSLLAAFIWHRRNRRTLLMGLLLASLAAGFFFVFSISGGLWWTIFVLAGASIRRAERAR
jgi:hypothetical protein